MPAVLTTAATLQCAHGGVFEVSAGQNVLTVDGQPVLTQADVAAATITTCPVQTKCTSVTSVAAGLSTTLTAGGAPVVLETATGTTNAGTWQVVSAGQTKLEAT
jgi:hypothetical protein